MTVHALNLDADTWPEQAEAKVYMAGTSKIIAKCGACSGTLQSSEQNRCPYVACRAVLRGRSQITNYRGRPGVDHA